MVILMCILYASSAKENTIMNITTFETFSDNYKNKVLAELARPKIEKKNAYLLYELKAMNDAERFSILSDKEKQKVLNRERPLRNVECVKTVTHEHIEYNFFSPDTIKLEEVEITLLETTYDICFYIGKDKKLIPIRYLSEIDLGYDFYNACLKKRKEILLTPIENF